MTPPEIIVEIKRQLTELKFEEGEFCLVVLKTLTFLNNPRKEIYKIYKKYSDFG